MKRQASPPGKSFEERWPDDARELEGFAGPIYPIAIGGVAGVLLLPLWLGSVIVGWPAESVGGLSAIAAILTLLVGRSVGGTRVRLLRLWRVAAYALPAGVVGIGLARFAAITCDASCATTFSASLTVPGFVVFLASVASSIAVAVAVEYAIRWLPRPHG